MFQISESTAHNYFNYWQEIFRKALPASLLEQVKKLGETEEDISQTLTNYELLIDSEEQPVERPSSYSEQKKHYSGKKKTKTKKNQIISLPKGADIVHVVAGELGPKSDIRICRENLKNFDNQQKFSGDKAYVGEKPIKTPKKKPKNEELTEKEKEVNKKISSTRIFIEHLIRIIKIFKITQERFRLNKSRYKSIFLTVCGLVRLRINALIIEIIKPSVSNKEIQIRLSHTLKQNLN